MSSKLRLFILLALMAALSVPTLAQTPEPICQGGINIGNLNLGGECRSNTIDPDTKSDLYRSMATAAYEVNQLPEQIQASGMNGQSVIPDTSGASQLFGYMKWILSYSVVEEFFGRTLAPLGGIVLAVLTITLVMTGLYILINFIVLIIKSVIWVLNQFLKLIPFW
jgi:hypothetical protein